MNLFEGMTIALSVPMDLTPDDPDCTMGLPHIWWGPPGIGKSSQAKQASRACILPMEVFYPATRQPEDFSETAFPDGQGGIKFECTFGPIRKALGWLTGGVIFVDEISCARPAVQGALLSLILERRVGSITLPPKVRLVAAANPADQAAGGWELELPMANRFAHFDLAPPTPDEWNKWLMNQGTETFTPSENLEKMVRENWSTAYAKASGQVSGFIKRRGSDLLLNIPAEGSDERGRAWPSPRTWEFALRSIATCYALQKGHHASAFVKACVGAGAEEEFTKYVIEANLPDPLDMLMHGWAPDKKRLDRTIAAYTSMAAFVARNDDETKLKWGASAWKLLEAACDAGLTDIALAAADPLVNAGLADEDVGKAIFDASKPVIRRFAKSRITEKVK